MKMSATLLMCSTMTTRTIRRIIFIVLVELVVPVQMERPLLSLLLIVSNSFKGSPARLANLVTDQKQARDLIAVLTEAKQQIDPRLMEMARYGGGGGGGSSGEF